MSPEKGRVIRENDGKNQYCCLQSGFHVTVFVFVFVFFLFSVH